MSNIEQKIGLWYIRRVIENLESDSREMRRIISEVNDTSLRYLLRKLRDATNERDRAISKYDELKNHLNLLIEKVEEKKAE